MPKGGRDHHAESSGQAECVDHGNGGRIHRGDTARSVRRFGSSDRCHRCGPRICAGADMSILNDAAANGPPQGNLGEHQRRHSWLLQVPKPIIAAINGPCVGLGFVISLYCDLRLASAQAKFSTVFAKRGLVAEYGMAWMLPPAHRHRKRPRNSLFRPHIRFARGFAVGSGESCACGRRVPRRRASLRH